jgi:hypothetical protein
MNLKQIAQIPRTALGKRRMNKGKRKVFTSGDTD